MLDPKYIKRNGKVDLWDLGPAKDDSERKAWEKAHGPHQVEFWAVDAIHALQVEPERYALKRPPSAKPGPAQELVEQTKAAAMQPAEKPDPHYGAQS